MKRRRRGKSPLGDKGKEIKKNIAGNSPPRHEKYGEQIRGGGGENPKGATLWSYQGAEETPEKPKNACQKNSRDCEALEARARKKKWSR